MKRLVMALAVMLACCLAATTVLAGGGGPPKNLVKGFFIKINPDNTAVFQKDVTREEMILKLPENIKPEDVPMNRKVLVTLKTIDHEITNEVKRISIMFINLPPSKVVALLVVGLIGGLLSGFIGSGGAFVLTPSMMSLGVPGAVAVASNMCHKFPKAMVGAYKRWKYGQADVKLGLVMAASAIIGVQIGIQIQKYILDHWGNAGSNLFVSLMFVIILVVVGTYVFYDAYKLSKGGKEAETTKLALALQKINLPPMIHFKQANIRISLWFTLPVGVATGMLAATIAVGGFIGVPGLIYVIGASAVVASATELVIAFVMGMWGSIQWGLSGLIDIRLTLLILAASLFGVQLGALGTTYVKDYMIKIVMGAVMLIVSVSRGAKIPGYLADLGLREPLAPQAVALYDAISFWALVTALGAAGIIITVAMIRGMLQAKAEERKKEAVSHG
jgi:uncharacterized membrane protein YfcA